MSPSPADPSLDRPSNLPAAEPAQVDAVLAPLHGSGHEQLAHEIRQAVDQSPFLARQFRKAAESGGIASIGTTSDPDALGSYYPGSKGIAVNVTGLERTVSRTVPGPFVDPREQQALAERKQDALTWVMGHEVWHADCEIHNPHGVPDLGTATWKAALVADAMDLERPRLDMTSRVNAYLDSRLDEEASAQLQGINALASRVHHERPLAGLANGSTARALLSPGVAEWASGFPEQMDWSNRLDMAVRRHQVLERIQQTGMTGCVYHDGRGALTLHEGLHMATDGTLDERSLPALRECAVSSSYRTLYFTHALESIRHGTEHASFNGEVRLDLGALGVDVPRAQSRMAELWKHGHRLTIHDPTLGPVTFGQDGRGTTTYGRRPDAAADPGSGAPQSRRATPASDTPVREPLQLQLEQAFHKVLPEGAAVSGERLAQFAEEARAAGIRPGDPITASLDGTRVMLRGQHPTHVASIDLATPAAPQRRPDTHQESAVARQPEPAHPHGAAMAH